MATRITFLRTLWSAAWLCLASAAVATPPPARIAEEVRFEPAPGILVAGTLERPPATAADQPLPVVVLVAGAGRWPRGGLPDLRARLLAAGIATLQFDKPGVGQSTGAFDDSLPAIARDVTGAVAFLRTRSGIDPMRIALLGHSQGAAAIPLVAAHDPAIAALVILSGPVGPRGGLFLGILRENLAAAGKGPAQIDRIAEAVGRWMDARSTGGNAEETRRLRAAAIAAFAAAGFAGAQAEGAVAALDTKVVLSMYEASTEDALIKTRAPVLAVYGTRDPIIAPRFSIPAAQLALRANRDAMVVAVPGLGHNLQRVEEGGTAEGPMTRAVSDLVSEWLQDRLRAGAVCGDLPPALTAPPPRCLAPSP